MSTRRICDSRCHSAKGPKCECWCQGKFHGSGGAPERALLTDRLQELPGGRLRLRHPRQEELNLGAT